MKLVIVLLVRETEGEVQQEGMSVSVAMLDDVQQWWCEGEEVILISCLYWSVYDDSPELL